jgi:hypothetical protein
VTILRALAVGLICIPIAACAVLAPMQEPGRLTLLGAGLIVIGIFVRRVAA